MKIAICAKLVPDTANLKFDAQGGLIQDGLDYVINPFDEYAVETALRVKEAQSDDTTIIVYSVGQANAKEALKKALAMGCDNAYLITDERWVGSDSMATASILSKAIQKTLPDADLIFFGQFSTDAMSGLTGPQVAEYLDYPNISFVKSVTIEGQTILVDRETEKGIEKYSMTLPGVLSIMKCDYEPRMPSIKGVMKANRTEIPILSLDDLGVEIHQVGLQGSSTQVLVTWKKPKKQGGLKVDGTTDPQSAVNQLMGYLKEQKVI